MPPSWPCRCVGKIVPLTLQPSSATRRRRPCSGNRSLTCTRSSHVRRCYSRSYTKRKSVVTDVISGSLILSHEAKPAKEKMGRPAVSVLPYCSRDSKAKSRTSLKETSGRFIVQNARYASSYSTNVTSSFLMRLRRLLGRALTVVVLYKEAYRF